jgi:hypothetical protein
MQRRLLVCDIHYPAAIPAVESTATFGVALPATLSAATARVTAPVATSVVATAISVVATVITTLSYGRFACRLAHGRISCGLTRACRRVLWLVSGGMVFV